MIHWRGQLTILYGQEMSGRALDSYSAQWSRWTFALLPTPTVLAMLVVLMNGLNSLVNMHGVVKRQAVGKDVVRIWFI